jgi:hypothetical protein
MNPKIWGKYVWVSIHVIALGYPDKPSDEEKNNYKEYFMNLWKVLPCYKCSINYIRHLKELPIDGALVDNISLFKWTVDLHNIVNKETGKRQMPFEEALDIYTKLAQGNGNDPIFVSVPHGFDTMIVKGTYVLGFAFALFLVFWFFRTFKKSTKYS